MSAGANLLRMIEDMQRLFTKLYDLAMAIQGGVFVIHIAMPNEPGTLGRVLTTIEAATGSTYYWPTLMDGLARPLAMHCLFTQRGVVMMLVRSLLRLRNQPEQ